MATTETKPKIRPFHETIIGAIRRTCHWEGMEDLAVLIMETEIPKNHAKIITAWKLRKKAFAASREDFGVMDSLRMRKQEAEKKQKELKRKRTA